VTLLAAKGMTNAAIAQDLFVTLKTVESHLGRVYRKLGVGSRRDLAAALQRSGATPLPSLRARKPPAETGQPEPPVPVT